MKKTSSLVTLIIVACVLLTVGLGCGKSDTTTTNTSTSNSTTANSTGSPTAASTAKTEAAPKSAPKDIAGTYTINGKNSDGGGGYGGDLIVTNRDDVYQFSWDSAGKKYDGVGVQTDNKVAVSFTDGTSGKGCGVTLYKINSDGSLDGKAGYWGNNQKETEKATRTGGTDLEGSYDIEGKNPEGETYKGKLTVKKEGEGYKFSWSGVNSFEGFGVKQGDSVAVGFGGANCGFVAYEIKSDGTLEGKWGGQGSTEFGSETAKKK
jgi:hypothetical protein